MGYCFPKHLIFPSSNAQEYADHHIKMLPKSEDKVYHYLHHPIRVFMCWPTNIIPPKYILILYAGSSTAVVLVSPIRQLLSHMQLNCASAYHILKHSYYVTFGLMCHVTFSRQEYNTLFYFSKAWNGSLMPFLRTTTPLMKPKIQNWAPQSFSMKKRKERKKNSIWIQVGKTIH